MDRDLPIEIIYRKNELRIFDIKSWLFDNSKVHYGNRSPNPLEFTVLFLKSFDSNILKFEILVLKTILI